MAYAATICRMGRTLVISSGMARLGRLSAVFLMLLTSFAIVFAPVARAECTDPTDDDWPCPAPSSQPAPKTPKPTSKPTSTPSATTKPVVTTAAPVTRTAAPIVRTNPNTPEPTPFELEVPEEDPLATPQIVVEGPLDDDTNFEVAEPTAGVSSWIFGFIFGFIVGGLVGRASWGLRRRRRQQIFG
jgi:hypothetical protein